MREEQAKKHPIRLLLASYRNRAEEEEKRFDLRKPQSKLAVQPPMQLGDECNLPNYASLLNLCCSKTTGK